MSKKEKVLGNKYGNWVVIDDNLPPNGNNRLVLVQCQCKNRTIKKLQLGGLKREVSYSCGCLSSKLKSENIRKHGVSHTSLYKLWKGIKQRCYNNKLPQYKDYGG